MAVRKLWPNGWFRHICSSCIDICFSLDSCWRQLEWTRGISDGGKPWGWVCGLVLSQGCCCLWTRLHILIKIFIPWLKMPIECVLHLLPPIHKAGSQPRELLWTSVVCYGYCDAQYHHSPNGYCVPILVFWIIIIIMARWHILRLVTRRDGTANEWKRGGMETKLVIFELLKNMQLYGASERLVPKL